MRRSGQKPLQCWIEEAELERASGFQPTELHRERERELLRPVKISASWRWSRTVGRRWKFLPPRMSRRRILTSLMGSLSCPSRNSRISRTSSRRYIALANVHLLRSWDSFRSLSMELASDRSSFSSIPFVFCRILFWLPVKKSLNFSRNSDYIDIRLCGSLRNVLIMVV